MRRRHRFGSLLAVTLALTFVAFAATVAAPSATAGGRNLTGQQAPDLYAPVGLYGLQSGSTMYSFRGRVVVLKFFFTECPACRASLPDFQAQYVRFASRGVQFIAVAYDTQSNVQALWSASRYTIPVDVDDNGITAGRYGVRTYPTNYLIGADGYVKSYDDISDWLIEREIARAGPAAVTSAPAAASGGPITGTRAADGAALSVGERNVRELGDVPLALAGVTEAARENDYGAVLRIVERHLDPAREAKDVLAAAKRIQAIAAERYQRRLARIEGRKSIGDARFAYEALTMMADDFRGTQYAGRLVEKAAQWKADLERLGTVAAR